VITTHNHTTSFAPRPRRGRVVARIVLHWVTRGRRTRLNWIHDAHTPPDATVTVSCRGRGGPARLGGGLRLSAPRFRHALDNLVFRAGVTSGSPCPRPD
jgi:hypothetical protein